MRSPVLGAALDDCDLGPLLDQAVGDARDDRLAESGDGCGHIESLHLQLARASRDQQMEFVPGLIRGGPNVDQRLQGLLLALAGGGALPAVRS